MEYALSEIESFRVDKHQTNERPFVTFAGSIVSALACVFVYGAESNFATVRDVARKLAGSRHKHLQIFGVITFKFSFQRFFHFHQEIFRFLSKKCTKISYFLIKDSKL